MGLEEQLKERMKNAAIGIGIDLRAELQRKVPVATGFLRDSIDFNVKVNGGVKISITMPPYAKYVEYGRPPHVDVPTLQDIKEWCKVKGIPEKLAFPIWRHILEHGTRPQPFIRPVLNTKLSGIIKKNLSNTLR